MLERISHDLWIIELAKASLKASKGIKSYFFLNLPPRRFYIVAKEKI